MGADMSDRGTQIQVALNAWSSMRGVTVVGQEKVTNECTYSSHCWGRQEGRLQQGQ